MAMGFGEIERILREGALNHFVNKAYEVPVPTEDEARRERRRRLDERARVLAQRKLEAVQAMDPEVARQQGRQHSAEVMNDPHRPGNSPVPEPYFHGDERGAREASYGAYGKYLGQLKGANDWNNMVNEFSLPVPTLTVNPLGNKFRHITTGYYDHPGDTYPDFRVAPQNALDYSRDPGKTESSMGRDLGPNAILSSKPVMHETNWDKSSYPVHMGAENPFELTPSPYSLSQFGQAMQRRFR
jgi:hypothetical protein